MTRRPTLVDLLAGNTCVEPPSACTTKTLPARLVEPRRFRIKHRQPAKGAFARVI